MTFSDFLDIIYQYGKLVCGISLKEAYSLCELFHLLRQTVWL